MDGGPRHYFADDGHWTSDGHAFAAEQLAAYLQGRALLPIR